MEEEFRRLEENKSIIGEEIKYGCTMEFLIGLLAALAIGPIAVLIFCIRREKDQDS